MQKIDYRSSDGININVVFWEGDFEPKAIIQISHGMAEHIKRYDEFAKFLVSNGYYVYGHDHRGHGETAGYITKLGYFSDKFGWKNVVDDLYNINCMIKERHKDKEIILFGHSMGSFIVRTFMYRYPNQVEKIILCGTGDGENFTVIGAKLLARSICITKGKEYRSKLVDEILNKELIKNIRNPKTRFDWLSTDSYEVDKYINDPYCGTLFTCGFYYDMYKGVEHLSMRNNIEKINKNVSMLILSGGSDPVGKNGDGVLKVVRSYKRSGIIDVNYKIYSNMRHEILKEVNRDIVFIDILNYLESK